MPSLRIVGMALHGSIYDAEYFNSPTIQMIEGTCETSDFEAENIEQEVRITVDTLPTLTIFIEDSVLHPQTYAVGVEPGMKIVIINRIVMTPWLEDEVAETIRRYIRNRYNNAQRYIEDGCLLIDLLPFIENAEKVVFPKREEPKA